MPASQSGDSATANPAEKNTTEVSFIRKNRLICIAARGRDISTRLDHSAFVVTEGCETHAKASVGTAKTKTLGREDKTLGGGNGARPPRGGGRRPTSADKEA